MKTANLVTWLSQAIGKATRRAEYCVAGTLTSVDPELVVEGLGPIEFPFERAVAKRLVAACHVAPYGKGERTLVDTSVRKTFELDPKSFCLGNDWNAALGSILPDIARQLGIPAARLRAHLYKLLVYEKGGFFLPHRDSEKLDGMVASLVVVLPNRFWGGKLVVRHGGEQKGFPCDDARFGKAPSYVAFYADCEHEVECVTSGVRVCLTYNLVLEPDPAEVGKRPRGSNASDALSRSLVKWGSIRPGVPLVFALEHQYTEKGLSLDLLKGNDRELADTLLGAVETADCLAYLAQVERHLLQFADDGSFGWGYRDRRAPRPRHPIEIGETFEDELIGKSWVDLENKAQPWERLPLDASAIVCREPLESWKPTEEHFEGYTGNAGNTLDRWYHRSAIVVWPRASHHEVLARMGLDDCVPMLGTMISGLAKTPKARREEAERDCARFARALVERWPVNHYPFDSTRNTADRAEGALARCLSTLADRESIARFLEVLAERDQRFPIASIVVSACKKHGWGAFASALRLLLQERTIRGEAQELPPRDVAWLEAICLEKSTDEDKPALVADCCASAVDRFVRPRVRPWGWHESSKDLNPREQCLPALTRALLASERDDLVARVLDFVEASPALFGLDHCQVPLLIELIPWCREHREAVPERVASWLESTRRRLEASTRARPTPPTNWSRPADLTCTCRYCGELKTFLADPNMRTHAIKAAEQNRTHLEHITEQAQCDVTHTLSRASRPFALVLTKTSASHERAVARYEKDLELLASLPVLGARKGGRTKKT